MKVLHVMPQIGIGGAETQLYALIVNSDPRLVTHEVLYYNDAYDTACKELFESGNVRLTRIPRNRRRPIRFLRDFGAMIREREPDIVHCWMFGGALYGRPAARLARAHRVVVTFRSSELPYGPLLRLVNAILFQRVYYNANSEACASSVAKVLHLSPDRFSVIHNGIDLDRFRVGGNREGFARQLGIPHDHRIAIMVGRLTPAKNHEMLLRLARRCRERLPVHFVIVGHGPREAELRALAEKMGVSDITHFLGLRRDVAELLAGADVFCFTSRWEGFPNALLEAMAAGLPIITSDFEGAEELITDGVNGRIVAIDDDEAAFEALCKYIDEPGEWDLMGQAARHTAETQFSMRRMVEETTAYYARILNGEQGT